MGPWWQVKDGDVSTNGDLNSLVPVTATIPYFDDIGIGGYPGIPAYRGNTSLTGATVSAKGWLAASATTSTKIYNSSFFLNSIPADTIEGALIQLPGSSVDGSFFENGGTTSYGYYWYEYDPALNGGLDLTINTQANLGSRKVILIVKGANVYLKGNIKLTKGSGFFLLVAAGNIIVDPIVGGGATANLEGIYVSDGQFKTGTTGTKTDSKLWIRGTVAAYGGMSLQRNPGGLTNETTPAELFEFAPDLALLFPAKLSAHSVSWQEVAP